MRILIVFFFCSFLINCKKKSTVKETILFETTTLDQKKESISSKINLNDFFLKEELEDINNTTWVSLKFIEDFYELHSNSKKKTKDFSDYPYTFIYLKNWQSGIIYSDGQKLDYRKLDLKLVNDSLYYVTTKNKHHYKNQKDSLFISKSNNIINFISKKDTIAYKSGLKNFPFKNMSKNGLINAVKIYNKSFNLFDFNNKLIENDIRFNLNSNTVEASNEFENFRLTPYFFNKKFKIEIDKIIYLFYWNKSTIFLEGEDGQLKYKLTVNDKR